MMSKKDYERFLRTISGLDKENLVDLKSHLEERKNMITEINRDKMSITTIMVIEELEKKIKLVTRKINSCSKNKLGV